MLLQKKYEFLHLKSVFCSAVLYNGPTDMPEYQELRLSDAYLGELREGEEDALVKARSPDSAKVRSPVTKKRHKRQTMRT